MKILENKIKNFPILGNFCISIYKRLTGKIPFKNSSEYWEERYKKGGNSGSGSYNELAEYKSEIINSFVEENNISSIIEFGSGDGNQLKYLKVNSYVGYDVSKSAILRCKNLYKNDPSKKFDLMNNHKDEKAELTLSLDVIYHLVEDEIYFNYMNKLFNSSTKFVIVYSSNDDDHENNNIAPHVKHRKFTTWIPENVKSFKLIKNIPNKFAYNGDGERTSYADFYIFAKE
ncbi:MAG: methyltransferase domain-containing protein [Melioribacteraceae bacterium]